MKLPETPALDEASLERTAAFAKERGLSNEAAQAVLEFANKEVAAVKVAVLEAHQPGGAEWTKTETAWRDAALADPELGAGKPEQLKAATDLAKRAFAKYFPVESIDFLDKTGLGSHPAVLKGLHRIGKAMSEGGLAVPGATGEAGRTEEDRLAVMYPSMVPK